MISEVSTSRADRPYGQHLADVIQIQILRHWKFEGQYQMSGLLTSPALSDIYFRIWDFFCPTLFNMGLFWTTLFNMGLFLLKPNTKGLNTLTLQI